MTRTMTANTTHGTIEFTLTGTIMNVLNCDTGENLCSGEFDQRIVDAIDNDENADRVGQEWADEFYGPADVFARLDEDGNYSILYGDGSPVTLLDDCWPLDSDLSGRYEHPDGIRLDAEQVERLGIEIED